MTTILVLVLLRGRSPVFTAAIEGQPIHRVFDREIQDDNIETEICKLESHHRQTFGEGSRVEVSGKLPQVLGGASETELLEREHSPVCTICGEAVPFDDLRSHLTEFHQGDWEFELERVAEVADEIKLGRHITSHDCRGTFNTLARQAQVPDRVIQALVGHHSDEMTERYDRVEVRERREAIGQVIQFAGLATKVGG